MMLIQIFLVMSILGSVAPLLFDETCYSEVNECYSNKSPYDVTTKRPLRLPLPESPKKMNTRLLLYTRNNSETYQVINISDVNSIRASNFSTNRTTRIVIHGYTDSAETPWVIEMCKAMLQVEDVNVIALDWQNGAKSPYTQAVSNIRVVATQVTIFIKALQDVFGYMPSNIHIIAHSLGAQLAGETGKRITVARITAMDPAQPFFQDTPPEISLDRSDAGFVDVIHTDSNFFIGIRGYGIQGNIGHWDVYPNGGKQMPGCSPKDALEGIDLTDLLDINKLINATYDLASCNHQKAHEYYTASILSPFGFLAFPADNYDEFQKGTSFPCPDKGCPRMGHYADRHLVNTTSPQAYFLNTGEPGEFPRYRYKCSLNITSGTGAVILSVSLEGSKGKTRDFTIYKGISVKSYTTFIDAKIDVGQVTKVTFVWKGLILGPGLGASNITVQFGKDRATYVLCGSGTVPKDTPQVLTPCKQM
ncbi:pancreatic lipase-related protein 2-like [Rana temporaria]|uniref:pancreatic lipase-related protein 2-like n=1 Tax=Rana temporaria TaxID=8407 RepID=UPI001AAD34C0|nr:pancreatic lipase-related protein 2-like [Rana temporaria]